MNEAHQRFHDWLTAGAEGDPPRDVAVHASVCAECRQSIVAFDRLTLVNPGLASVPAEPTGRERGRLAGAGRLIGATVILFSALILGVGVSQLIGVSRTNAPVAQASSTLDQNVLGEAATPQPSPEAMPTPIQETLTPLATPAPTPRPPVLTPAPRRTAAPTPIPTAVPPASPSPSEPPPTPSPSPSEPPPTPSPSPSEPPPTPSPSPTPTPTPTPPLDSDSDGVSDVDELLYESNPNDPNSTPENKLFDVSKCSDAVDNDLDLTIDSADTGCQP